MKKRARILIVDDEQILRESMQDWLSGAGYDVTIAGSAEEGLQILKREKNRIMIADLVMPGMDGIELMREAKKIVPTISTIIVTAHGTIQTAITAMREGAHDYIEKPFCPERVELLINGLVKHQNLIEENRSLRQRLKDRYRFQDIIAKSPKMLSMLELVKTVAPTNATILILGPSGTGKEVIARAIHTQSSRRDKPLIVTSCAALPESLLESELFGHEKGSFTGATERKIGKFEAAHKGTLFLDEIGEINENTQVHLLRALEEKKITRVGGNEEIPVAVRVIAATSQDLKALIEQGRFREDLYYRLNVVTIDLPPLKERREDILPLAEHFLSKADVSLARQRPRGGEHGRAGRDPGQGRDDHDGRAAARHGSFDRRGRGYHRRGGEKPHPEGARRGPGQYHQGRTDPRHRADDALQQAEEVRLQAHGALALSRSPDTDCRCPAFPHPPERIEIIR